jgi:hypothetical protein
LEQEAFEAFAASQAALTYPPLTSPLGKYPVGSLLSFWGGKEELGLEAGWGFSRSPIREL